MQDYFQPIAAWSLAFMLAGVIFPPLFFIGAAGLTVVIAAAVLVAVFTVATLPLRFLLWVTERRS